MGRRESGKKEDRRERGRETEEPLPQSLLGHFTQSVPSRPFQPRPEPVHRLKCADKHRKVVILSPFMLHSVTNKWNESKRSRLVNSILKDTANAAAKIYNRAGDMSAICTTFSPKLSSMKRV